MTYLPACSHENHRHYRVVLANRAPKKARKHQELSIFEMRRKHHKLTSQEENPDTALQFILFQLNKKLAKQIKGSARPPSSDMKFCIFRVPSGEGVFWQMPRSAPRISKKERACISPSMQYSIESEYKHFTQLISSLKTSAFSARHDRPILESATRDLMTYIGKLLPHVSALSGKRRLLLQRILFSGQRAGFGDQALKSIAYDLAHAVTGGNEEADAYEFMLMLKTIVIVKHVKSLHINHIKKYGGKGVDASFSRFANDIMRIIRDGRIHFRIYRRPFSNAKASYSSGKNTLYLPPFDLDEEIASGEDINTTIHELYHLWQDARKNDQLTISEEVDAHVYGMKAKILYETNKTNDSDDKLAWAIAQELQRVRQSMTAAGRKTAEYRRTCIGFDETNIENSEPAYADMNKASTLLRSELQGAHSKEARALIRRSRVASELLSMRTMAAQVRTDMGLLYDYGLTDLISMVQQGAFTRIAWLMGGLRATSPHTLTTRAQRLQQKSMYTDLAREYWKLMYTTYFLNEDIGKVHDMYQQSIKPQLRKEITSSINTPDGI